MYEVRLEPGIMSAPRVVQVEWELDSIDYVITDENRVVPKLEAEKADIPDGGLQGKGVHILDMPNDLWNKLGKKDWRRCQAIWDQEIYAQQCENHHMS